MQKQIGFESARYWHFERLERGCVFEKFEGSHPKLGPLRFQSLKNLVSLLDVIVVVTGI